MEVLSGKEQRLIVLHAGIAEGWVPDGDLMFRSKTNSADCHNEMNSELSCNNPSPSINDPPGSLVAAVTDTPDHLLLPQLIPHCHNWSSGII